MVTTKKNNALLFLENPMVISHNHYTITIVHQSIIYHQWAIYAIAMQQITRGK